MAFPDHFLLNMRLPPHVFCLLILLYCSYTVSHSVINRIIFHWLSFASSYQYLACRWARGSPIVGGKQQSQRAGGGGESPGLRWENRDYGGQLVCASLVSSILAVLRARGTQPFPLAHLAAASSSSLPLFSPYPTGRTG